MKTNHRISNKSDSGDNEEIKNCTSLLWMELDEKHIFGKKKQNTFITTNYVK